LVDEAVVEERLAGQDRHASGSMARGELGIGRDPTPAPARRDLRDNRRDPDCAGGASPSILNHMVHYSNRLDTAFAALSDPTRRGILERLGRGNASISEL